MKKYVGMIVMAAMLSLTGCGSAVEETANPAADATAAPTTEAAAEETTAAPTTESAMQSETEDAAAAAETTAAPETTAVESTAAQEPTTAETAAAEANAVFALNGPLGRHQGVEEFDNAAFAASLGTDALTKHDDGTFTLTTMIYCYELFSEEDVQSLQTGDTIWCLGEAVVVETIETLDSGLVVVNGGIEHGGRYFKKDDAGVYCESGMNDVHSYYEIGENTYTLSADFVFTDNSDLDHPKTYTAEELMALLAEDTHFINSNTIVKTTDGVVTAIVRNYIP